MGKINAMFSMALYEMLKGKTVMFNSNKIITNWLIIEYFLDDEEFKKYKFHFMIKENMLLVKIPLEIDH